VGNALTKVQDIAVDNMPFEEIVTNLVRAKRPLHLTFWCTAKRQEGDKRPPLLRHKSAPLHPVASILTSPFPPADDDEEGSPGDANGSPDAAPTSLVGELQAARPREVSNTNPFGEQVAVPESPPASPSKQKTHKRQSSNPFDQVAAPPSSPGNPFGKSGSASTRPASEVTERESPEKESPERMSLPNVSSASASSAKPDPPKPKTKRRGWFS
jgi:hypothetical protein